MAKYGQYCPVAQALEILGDRWTLLIIRDMLTGTVHFNDMVRGLPGISKPLLAKRLHQLQEAGVVEKRNYATGRNTTEYQLTPAGRDLDKVIGALLWWGTLWAFDDPSKEELDPLLLMWWMRNRVCVDYLPEERIVVQFQFRTQKTEVYWLILMPEDVTICLTDPGHEVNIIIKADLSTFFKVWLGRIEFTDAVNQNSIDIDGNPRLIHAFPSWFAWSPAAPVVREIKTQQTT